MPTHACSCGRSASSIPRTARQRRDHSARRCIGYLVAPRCDITPEIGVTGTPAIDSANSILYVVSKSVNSGKTTFYHDCMRSSGHRYRKDRLAGGDQRHLPGTATAARLPRSMCAPRTSAQLALVNGTVYISWHRTGSGPWYGWMMATPTTVHLHPGVAAESDTQRVRRIWMSAPHRSRFQQQSVCHHRTASSMPPTHRRRQRLRRFDGEADRSLTVSLCLRRPTNCPTTPRQGLGTVAPW